MIELREYCLSKPGTTEALPFDDTTLVFKVMNKIFCLVSLDADPLRINLKCDPEYAIELRERHPAAVLPGYHMNKKHWNTVIPAFLAEKSMITELIDHSYDMVVKRLKKSEKEELRKLGK